MPSTARKPRGLLGNLLVGGGLLAFVGGTYWKTIHNVSSDDLEAELERELLEEDRRQRKADAAAEAKHMTKQRTQRAATAGQGREVARAGGVAKLRSRPAVAAAVGGSEASPGTSEASSGKPNRPPTAFESRLYAVCKCIPAGSVTTYGAMAAVLGSAPRACGQALRRNPFAPEVPCHRVIAASLELGGFSGSWGVGCANVVKKRRLLAEEGVAFDDAGKLLTAAAVMDAGRLRAAAEAAGVL
ncbi:RING-2 [Micractinium conductrix]|uniref:Methylated-DNA--protein-cysteine methyltransferase n=1 Tax=Micractinium conductrix TaxID=554055 RepID=A0A2P6VS58_9CHLO|nr:RING-2 [Micractinium conductrix]|eukprot:PSC76921.1 RING-2 [Micractinium conductrix]